MTKEELIRIAKGYGADLVGIASMDRFEGAPTQMDPRFIMPEAKSMIVMGFRVMRGSLRGIEEGTFFSNYSAMGYGGLTYTYIPMTVINICRQLEDEVSYRFAVTSPSLTLTLDGHDPSAVTIVSGHLKGVGEVEAAAAYLTALLRCSVTAEAIVQEESHG